MLSLSESPMQTSPLATHVSYCVCDVSYCVCDVTAVVAESSSTWRSRYSTSVTTHIRTTPVNYWSASVPCGRIETAWKWPRKLKIRYRV